jgi:biopolymer transport protein ExbD
MAKKPQPPAARTTGPSSDRSRKLPSGKSGSAKPAAAGSTPRPATRSVWPLVGDATLALAAVTLALVAAFVGPAAVAAPRPARLIVDDAAASTSPVSARIDSANQLFVGEKPCPSVTACLDELSAGSSIDRVQIVADGDAPFATLAALVEALRRRGAADVHVNVSR